MKQLIKKTIALIFTVLLCALPTVQAKEIDGFCLKQILVSEETIQQNDLYITVSVFEDENIANTITPYSNTFEKSGSKTYTAKNADKETLFTFTVHATFSVNSGVSATCTKSSYSYTITDNAWEKKSASASRSGNQAIGDAEFIKKLLFITVDTFNAHVVLTCNSNGQLS